MSFSKSSNSLRIDAPAILRARCRRSNGEMVDASLDLNPILANHNGQLNLSGKNFADTAMRICLKGSVLHVKLYRKNGRTQHNTLDLDKCVSNEEGHLKFHPDCFYAAHGNRLSYFNFPLAPRIDDAAACPNCHSFPISPSGGPEWDVGFFTCVGDFTIPESQTSCPICQLLKRIAERLSQEDPRYDYSNTICIGGRKPGQLAWIGFEFMDDRRKQEFAKIQRFFLYRNADTPVESETFADISNGGHFGFDPRSDETILQAREWIDECVHTHAKCANTDGFDLPIRILDLGTGDSETVQLVIPTGQKCVYACLSYCWGDAVGANLTRDNLDEFKKGVQIGSLPKTYRDAIPFCRRLSIRYLWIDALCIMQKNAEDWLRESVKMDQYYGNSYVCIAATSSKTLDSGCNAHISSMKFTGRGRDNKPYALYVRPVIPHIIDDEESRHFPLLTRAWCYQERRLAPRVLHFSGNELFFECAEGNICQCGQPRRRSTHIWTKDDAAFYVQHRNISTIDDKRKAVEYEWYANVHSFSGLRLTKNTDKLLAISGVAKRCKESKEQLGTPSGRYLAGIWENNLIDGMSWCVGKDLTGHRNEGNSTIVFGARNHSDVRRPKPNDYIAPSWSWASGLDQVEYNVPFSNPLCTVISAETSLTGESPLGQVNGGSVVLRGKLHSCHAEWIETGMLPKYWGLINFPGTKLRKCMKWYPDYDLQEFCGKRQDLFLMPLTSRRRWEDHRVIAKLLSMGYLTVYLVLKSRGAGTYKRIGWAYTEGDAIDTETREVDIKIV